MTEKTGGDFLKNKRVLFTGDKNKYPAYFDELMAENAIPECVPFIETTPVPLNEYAQKRMYEKYVGVLFTSSNAVKWGLDALPDGINRRMTSGKILTFCVGKTTRHCLAEKGVLNAILPDNGDYSLDGITKHPAFIACKGHRILYPTGNLSDKTRIATYADQLHIGIDAIEVYKNECPANAVESADRYFSTATPDWIIVNSPSAGKHLKNWVDQSGVSLIGINFVLIGNTTRAYFEADFSDCVFVTAENPSAEYIVVAMNRFEQTTPPANFQ